jgi:hypothetical protein
MNKSGICVNTFTTKYNVGDKFWIMSQNMPKEFEIVIVEVEIRATTFTVKYIGDGARYSEQSLDCLARTKEILMTSVFGV